MRITLWFAQPVGGGLVVQKSDGSTLITITNAGLFVPGADNSYPLGTAALRFSDVRANTATFSGAVNAAFIYWPADRQRHWKRHWIVRQHDRQRGHGHGPSDSSGELTASTSMARLRSPLPAAAGTLTGATLAAGVTGSSLTSVGVLSAPHMTSLVVDSGGLTVTAGGAAITGATSIHAADLSLDSVQWVNFGSVPTLYGDANNTLVRQPVGGGFVLQKSDGTTFLAIANSGTSNFGGAVGPLADNTYSPGHLLLPLGGCKGGHRDVLGRGCDRRRCRLLRPRGSRPACPCGHPCRRHRRTRWLRAHGLEEERYGV